MSRSSVKFVNGSFSCQLTGNYSWGVIEQRSCLSDGKEKEKERPEESDVPIRVDE